MALSASTSFETQQLMAPQLDEYGRYRTLNQMGYADPQKLPTSEEFLEWGRQRARISDQGGPRPGMKLHTIVEIGGGFGFVAARAVNEGISYVYNDMCEGHREIAESQFERTNYDSYVCKFPEDATSMVRSIQMNKKVVGLGAFSVLHFLSAKEVGAFLSAVYELLEPGGRAFFTFASPYNALFSLFPWVHARKKAKFFEAPDLHPFPGEIPNARQFFHPRRPPRSHVVGEKAPTDRRQVQYPNFFNAMDPDTFSYLVNNDPGRPFEIISIQYIRRPHPPNQAVAALYASVGELVGVVLQKPGELPRPGR